jgi:LuxR family transcriptional regulator, maltose regulon positive regulatory protein
VSAEDGLTSPLPPAAPWRWKDDARESCGRTGLRGGGRWRRGTGAVGPRPVLLGRLGGPARQNGPAQAYVLGAIARDSLGDSGAADRALERALDLAEPDGLVLPFLLHPAPGLLDRHARHPTAHASLLAEIQDRLSGTQPSPRVRPRPLLAALSESEIRVLRYLPTHLSAPEIARELFVSPNTVRTHVKSLYAKLGTHHRAEAVERARALGLLAPTGMGRASRHDRPAANRTRR